MAEFVLKYADPRGRIHQQVAEANTEGELREKLSQQGYLIYSIRPKSEIARLKAGLAGKRRKLNLEKFLIFNQQFVTLVRAGLPILKSLDLLAERLTDERLKPHIAAVRDQVKNGQLLSDAFASQGTFPPIYVSSILAGEKSGSLAEVLDRYITYQRLALSVRKKVLLSLMYPALLIFLVIGLVVFLVTYVVPSFAGLYQSMQAELPYITQLLIAVGTTARAYIAAGFLSLAGLIVFYKIWSRGARARAQIDYVKMHVPLLGEIWLKYQVAQFSRVLSTLLIGGIPLVQALETAGESLGTSLLKRALAGARQKVKEGQALSRALTETGIFPDLSIDMIEVGESTGALPQMLTSVAEFYEDDVQMRMTAVLSLIEPAIMIFMGIFVAFVLVALYLPIFSLADSAGRG